jgi:glycosyltransferase involved in cell wall biosynthesis
MNNTEIRIQGIRIVAPSFDGSGYASGSRNYIKGLVKAGVPFWINPVSFEKDRPDLTTVPFDKSNPAMGSMFDMLDGLCKRPVPHDINFVRLSPEVGINFLEPNSINVLSTAWEVSLLHPHWTECCNKFDAVFVESQFAVDVFKNSGVTVPVYCVPNYENISDYSPKAEANLKGTYKFYSIQQWTERKNGAGLLKAYFNAFTPDDDVLLILKTYITRVEENQNQRDVIKEQITNLKRAMNLPKNYPPVFLIADKLTDDEIIKMHEECDCYVCLDRGESWGIPFANAAAAGNPIIGTDWGGTRQFLNEKNSYPVKYQLTYVDNMAHFSPFYSGFQQWADASLPTASALMRHVYDNREEAFQIGKLARETIEKYYNQETVTQALLNAIADVVANKRGIR